MRLLFTFVGGRGHFEPLVPIARAAAETGHEVAFGCDPSQARLPGEADFRVFRMGPGGARLRERLPLRPPDPAREERDLRERFARRAATARVPLTLALCGEWRPDVLVCDETDFGAMVAAECLELPFATVLVIATGAFVRAEVVGPTLDELRSHHGLAPDPCLAMPSRYLVLSPFPGSLRDPAHPPPDTWFGFRPRGAGSGEGGPSPWSAARPDAPVVYATLGTVFNLESGDLLARMLAGLRELPVNLVVTVGEERDPAELGAQPAHVRVARYLPQAAVLPHCALVVSHAGSGSVLGALAHGLPSVLIPLGADQPLNARRCGELGVATVLDAVGVSPAGVRRAAWNALRDPVLRRSAEHVRDEIAALPEPARTVVLLERLARERRPVAPGSLVGAPP